MCWLCFVDTHSRPLKFSAHFDYSIRFSLLASINVLQSVRSSRLSKVSSSIAALPATGGQKLLLFLQWPSHAITFILSKLPLQLELQCAYKTDNNRIYRRTHHEIFQSIDLLKAKFRPLLRQHKKIS